MARPRTVRPNGTRWATLDLSKPTQDPEERAYRDWAILRNKALEAKARYLAVAEEEMRKRRQKVRALRERLGSWKAVAYEMGISTARVQQLAKGGG